MTRPEFAIRQSSHEGAASESSLRGYQDLAPGSRSLTDLLRHEILGVYGGLVPGAAGLLLRKTFWPRLFLECGQGTVWGRSIVLRHASKMRIGRSVAVDDGCFFDAKGSGSGGFTLGDEVLISRDCIVSGKHGPIHLGKRTNIGARCTLYSAGGIDIGADTLLAANCYIGGGRYDHRARTDVPMSRQPLAGRGVVIGDDCWLGAGAVVTDGVRIGRGCVIGAGAVVTADIPEYSIAVGVPARIVGHREITAE